MVEIGVKRLKHKNDSRTQSYQEDRRKDEKYKREEHLDGGLRSLFLHLLDTLGSEAF
jgi:hypothetical protein